MNSLVFYQIELNKIEWKRNQYTIVLISFVMFVIDIV